MSRTACALSHVIFLLSLCSPGSLNMTYHINSSNSVLPAVTTHRYPSWRGSRGAETGCINRPCYPNPQPQMYHSTERSSTVSQSIPSTTERAYRDILWDYVHIYKDSSSKYGTLLAGLARRNFVMLTAEQRNRPYQYQYGEFCKFGIRTEKGDYEETRIPCELISSYIWAEEEKSKSEAVNSDPNRKVNTNNDNSLPNANLPTSFYTRLPNGTIVPVGATSSNFIRPNIVMTSNVVTSPPTPVTMTPPTVRGALDSQNDGPQIEVTDGMWCYMIRHMPTSNMGRTISCALVQAYGADTPA